ncbi:MAG TPA: mechanosensitive ion channel family protein [Sporosarcina sp.]|nr:mechanosensitive ion channel family protein [Sporosarcina sp.]
MILAKEAEGTEAVSKLKAFLLNSEIWSSITDHIVKILIIILLASITVKIGKMVIRRMFSFKVKTKIRPSERREKTLLKLLENTLSYIVYFSAILAILSDFMDISGLLASAGVLGLAVGFGAQSLVKDVISGFFIIFEDQFSVDDYVQIGEAEGTVMEIGLRTTKVEAYGGEVYIIPNGNITEVVNYSINNGLAIIDIKIDYHTDIQKAEQLIEHFISNLSDEYEELVALPTLIGVQDLNATEIVFRVTAETLPAMQWAFGRRFRKDLKLFLDENGIEIPYPKMTYEKVEGSS